MGDNGHDEMLMDEPEASTAPTLEEDAVPSQQSKHHASGGKEHSLGKEPVEQLPSAKLLPATDANRIEHGFALATPAQIERPDSVQTPMDTTTLADSTAQLKPSNATGDTSEQEATKRSKDSTPQDGELISFPASSSADVMAMRQFFISVRDELVSAHLKQQGADEMVLACQKEVSAAANALEAAEVKSKDGTTTLGTVEALRKEVTTLNEASHAAREERCVLEQKLQQRDRTIAEEAQELTVLRQQVTELPSLRQQVSQLETRISISRTQYESELEQSNTRKAVAEENLNALKEEVMRLNAELTKSRSEADAAKSVSSAALAEAHQRSNTLQGELMDLNSKIVRLETELNKVESQRDDALVSSKQFKTSFEAENERLRKAVKLLEEQRRDAEQRIAHHEEIINKLKRDVSKREEAAAPRPKLAQHTEALLKDVESALQSRWKLLESQRIEMERARQSEMSILARQEKLQREAKEARFEAEQSRKEALRYRRQVDEQSEEMHRLKRKTDGLLQSERPLSTPRRESGEVGRPSFWNSSDLGRQSGIPSDIGPASIIPKNQPSTPSALPNEVATAVREMTEIRERQERLLASLRESRLSFS